MPFINVVDNSIQDRAQLAGNIGNNATGQQNLHNQLALNQDARAQQASNLAASSGEESYLRTILGDITRRQINTENNDRAFGVAGINADRAFGVQGMRGNQKLQQIDQQFGNQQTLQDDRQKYGAEQGDLNRGVRSGIAFQSDQTRQRGQDLTSGLGYDRMAMQKAIAENNDQRADRELKARESQRKADEQRRIGNRQAADIIEGHNIALRHAYKMIDEWSGKLAHAQQYKGMEADAAEAYKAFWHWYNVSQELAKNNPMGAAQQQPMPTSQPVQATGQPGAMPQQQADPVPIQDEMQYMQLPPGTAYVTPDGLIRIKQ